jgi:hypothetical protein
MWWRLGAVRVPHITVPRAGAGLAHTAAHPSCCTPCRESSRGHPPQPAAGCGGCSSSSSTSSSRSRSSSSSSSSSRRERLMLRQRCRGGSSSGLRWRQRRRRRQLPPLGAAVAAEARRRARAQRVSLRGRQGTSCRRLDPGDRQLLGSCPSGRLPSTHTAAQCVLHARWLRRGPHLSACACPWPRRAAR